MRPPAADTLRVLSLSDADDAGFAHSVMEIMTQDRQEVVDDLVERQEVVAGSRRRRTVPRGCPDERERRRGATGGAGPHACRAAGPRREHGRASGRRPGRGGRPGRDRPGRVRGAGGRRGRAARRGSRRTAPTDGGGDVGVVGETAPTPTTAPPTSGGGGTPTTGHRPHARRPRDVRRPHAAHEQARLGAVDRRELVRRDERRRDLREQVDRRQRPQPVERGDRRRVQPAWWRVPRSGRTDRHPARQLRSDLLRHLREALVAVHAPDRTTRALDARAWDGHRLHVLGSSITSRSDPAFLWLRNNASRFGLYNLPSEPWHWSTNGN